LVWITLAAAGCSSDQASTGASQHREVGSAELNLSLPDNTTIDTVTYNVTQTGSSYTNTGMIPVANSSELKFQVGNIPSGTGYQISLSATTSGSQTCSAGPVSFAIMPSNATLVMMTLRCGGGTAASTKGNVRVDVDVVTASACAAVDGLTVLPRSVNVGGSMALQGFATIPAGATYGWAVAPASGGTFSSTTASMTSFTCAAAGMYTVTLSVSSGGTCTPSTADVPVICTGATGVAGTGVAGTGVAGTGVAGTGVAGTGVAGTGVAGTGVAGTGGEPSICDTCELANATCSTRQMDCNNITGTVNGVAKSALCHQVLDCVRTTKCASASGTFSPSDCICGTGADVSVCAGQTLDQVTGACKAIIAQGAESTLLTDVSVRLGDPAYATGLAIRLVQCDQRFCATDCPF
jgi:hypothetical protein